MGSCSHIDPVTNPCPFCGAGSKRLRLKRIHVNQHVIKANAQKGEDNPPLTVKLSDANHRGHTVRIDGPSELVYRPEKPLDCGARLWIETRSPVQVRAKGAPEVDC